MLPCYAPKNPRNRWMSGSVPLYCSRAAGHPAARKSALYEPILKTRTLPLGPSHCEKSAVKNDVWP